MAYMNQERKNELKPAIMAVCKKYGVKATLSTDAYSIRLNVASGKIDFLSGTGREYAEFSASLIYDRDGLSKIANRFMNEVSRAMMTGNHYNSDIMTDYFDVGWYAYINIGRWNKPYIVK